MDLQGVFLCWKLLFSVVLLNAGAAAVTYSIVVLDTL
jgi:hypothetical protein